MTKKELDQFNKVVGNLSRNNIISVKSITKDEMHFNVNGIGLVISLNTNFDGAIKNLTKSINFGRRFYKQTKG